MGIFEKLKILIQKKPSILDFCIETIRFRKLLENAQALLLLFEDGNEKNLGEYILDRHYVTSLIDSVVERLGMVVYDASVLAPGSGEELYNKYDNHKLRAMNLHKRHDDSEKKDLKNNLEISVDPEYKLLSEVLKWMNDESFNSESTVMAFMKQIFVSVIKSLDPTDNLKTTTILSKNIEKEPGSNIYLIKLWEDTVAKPLKLNSFDIFNSIPLKLLLMDANKSDALYSLKNKNKNFKWIAAVSEYKLSLSSLESDFKFHLEASASGQDKSDFIFVFADKSVNTENILPSGFYTENTDSVKLDWSTHSSTKNIENNLITIGRNLIHENILRV